MLYYRGDRRYVAIVNPEMCAQLLYLIEATKRYDLEGEARAAERRFAVGVSHDQLFRQQFDSRG